MSNVRDFGAVGDGQTNDTDALRHAVAAGGGRLVFPRGAYRLTAPLEIDLDRSGPIALAGEGGTARLLMDGPGPAVRLVGTHYKSADPASFEPRVWRSQRLPTVSELEFVGNHEQADGIELEGTMQATITGVSVRRCRFGIHLVKRNRNVLLADSHIYDGRSSSVGVFFDRVNLHQTIITGCHISLCKHAGIKVLGGEIRNLQITGCDIEYNFDPAAPDSADIWIDAREGTIREGTIASNTIQAKGSPRGANVRIEGAERGDSAGAGLWAITGNVVMDQQINVWLRNCRGITLTGNTIASGLKRSIVLEGCRDVVVGSNVLDHNPDYSGTITDGIRIVRSAGINLHSLIMDGCRAGGPDEGGAIEVVDSSEVLILGCQVLDPEFRGIDVRNCRNTNVSACTIVDRRAHPTMHEPVRIVGSTKPPSLG
jgi:Right handed beta helix region/Pectate lyase superfamily protein